MQVFNLGQLIIIVFHMNIMGACLVNMQSNQPDQVGCRDRTHHHNRLAGLYIHTYLDGELRIIFQLLLQWCRNAE